MKICISLPVCLARVTCGLHRNACWGSGPGRGRFGGEGLYHPLKMCCRLWMRLEDWIWSRGERVKSYLDHLPLCVCVCLEVRGQFSAVSSLISLCDFQRWNSVHRQVGKHLYPLNHLDGPSLIIFTTKILNSLFCQFHILVSLNSVDEE